jgi:hypothetical protein
VSAELTTVASKYNTKRQFIPSKAVENNESVFSSKASSIHHAIKLALEGRPYKDLKSSKTA